MNRDLTDSMENTDLCFWQRLPFLAQDKPVVLYGMGNGADKLLRQLEHLGVQPDGIFASDEFVRGQSFAGWPVLTYTEAKQRFGQMVVLVCFGTERPEVLANINKIAAEQELYAPHLPLFGQALFDADFATHHQEQLQAAAQVWADTESKSVYENYLRYMWTGRIDYLQAVASPRQAVWPLLRLGADEVYLDLGAYDGDTVREFASVVQGKWRQIWALEPDAKNFAKLQISLNAMPQAQALQLAIWHNSGSLDFAGLAGRNSAVMEPEAQVGLLPKQTKKLLAVSAVSLDKLHRDYLQSAPTFIKMDVEGAEEQALLGGRHLLADFKPKLAVAAYHRTEDIFRLPLLIKELNPNYKLYLRHHPYIPGWETNIYAV